MAETQMITIEVAYARPDTQVIIPLQVNVETTVLEAINLSGVMQKFPEIDMAQNKVGIFSKITKADTVLQDKDRVEIYRALIADPKESRRARANKKQQGKEEV